VYQLLTGFIKPLNVFKKNGTVKCIHDGFPLFPVEGSWFKAVSPFASKPLPAASHWYSLSALLLAARVEWIIVHCKTLLHRKTCKEIILWTSRINGPKKQH
jgi:hypothetical protein